MFFGHRIHISNVMDELIGVFICVCVVGIQIMNCDALSLHHFNLYVPPWFSFLDVCVLIFEYTLV